ncbi:hypothetical protein [Streptomyces sp. NPDC048638]|uniref:hypothetical protein n=1 Tax=Streptomyces sp. NPDC048638 TaxID=3365580 RepID=UPI00371D1E98
MSDEFPERAPDPVKSDAAAPGKRLSPFFGIAKGGQRKCPEPGTPGSLSHLIALQLVSRGTPRLLVVDVDAQGTGPRPHWVDQ